MIKVILYMAISVNGIIARENNEEDFLSHANWGAHVALAKQTGCMIWGRKTHEVVKTWEEEYKQDIKDIKKVVVSSNLEYVPGGEYSKVNSPKEALELLEKEGFSSVILVGGSHLNSSFAKENLIDEIVLNIEPVVVGKGTPVFSPDIFDLKLELIEHKNVNGDLVQLHYKVVK